MVQDSAVARSDPQYFFSLFLAERSPHLFDPGTMEFILAHKVAMQVPDCLIYFTSEQA
tara:strand:- start:2313 stop:2486 length:174 start_codon:yes stop_codon:yes gene_type:complete